MSLKLLLDEHISPLVAKILARRGLDVRTVAASPLASLGDADLLRLSARENRVFVTYDTGTIPATFAELFRSGTPLPGLVLVSSTTIPSKNISTLAKALERFADQVEAGEIDPFGGIFLERV